MTKAARTRIDDREALKKRYVEEAARIIAAEGLSALTARRLAGNLGVAVGTTYNLFANLDEIVVAVNGRTLDGLAAAIAAEPLPAESVEAALIALSDRYLGFVRSNRNLWQALFETAAPGGGEGPFPNQPRFEALFAVVEGVLGPLFPPGKEAARARSARVLWAGLHGISMLVLSQRLAPLGVATAEDLVKTLVCCHVAGLRSAHEG
ncbi:TetR/AcrR family transcriptional regulator [Rhodobium gokarnense]|uniref:AcrR family transcriptional regulator n=1 Tax=Rhodobium gokarnense TaxID=364296 RepID=A0ABT3H9S9_9HYPH|nr:TetR-like C-terminal domain-containing protein [Rhodobium gokarnense]MCW2307145.1 AcrR family transcriptional regulator [Rhodobium gokarnense]